MSPSGLFVTLAVVCGTLSLGAGEPMSDTHASSFEVQVTPDENPFLTAVLGHLTSADQEALGQRWRSDGPGLMADLERSAAALPTGPEGRLEPTTSRYVLHRLFLRRRGWLVKGLDPQGQAWNSSSPAGALVLAHLPEGARAVVAAQVARPGLDLKGVATLALLIEHLVHKEEARRFQVILKMQDLQGVDPLTVDAALQTAKLYAVSYVLGQHPSFTNRSELVGNLQAMSDIYPNWPNVDKAMTKSVEKEVQDGHVKAQGLQQVVRDVVNTFWRWQEPACSSMKTGLMTMEDRGTGRVRLADFYNKALHEGKWQLSESVPYLRILGALDETNPRNMRVIIPNYVFGASNCLATSGHLSVCCISECEALMGQLEQRLATPAAPAATVAEIVAALPSSTVPANRSLSNVMLHRLNRIAADHEGTVPLHGRMFAQWLHHAYPRECPYPHLSGQTHPLQAEDWMKTTGQDVSASPLAMAEHAGYTPSQAPLKQGPVEGAIWSYEEELFVPHPANEPTGLLALHGAVYVAALAVMTFGFMLAKMARSGRRAAKAAQLSAKRQDDSLSENKLYVV